MTGNDEKRTRWNRRYASAELIWSAGPNALLAEELAGLKSGTALDAACGEGRNGLWLAEQGWQVTAVDFSEVAIEKGRKIARHRGLDLDWRVADVARDPLPEGAFDLVVVLYLHTDADERALWLPRLVRAVAPGGTFFYLGHDPRNIEQGLGGPQDPDLLPDAGEIVDALSDFRIISAGIHRRPVDADPGHGRETAGTALDTFVRAVAPTPF